jgi:predicted DNA-binding transcriptional regulator AlpA
VALFTQPRLLACALLFRAHRKGVREVKRYLTVKELAEKLHVCRASIYNYIKKIPDFPQPRKIGRLSRWDAEEMDAFMSRAPRGVYGEGCDRRNIR